MAIYTHTLDEQGGSGTRPSQIYLYVTGYGSAYLEAPSPAASTRRLNQLDIIPSRECFKFNGFFTGQNGAGSQIVQSDGDLRFGLHVAPRSNAVLYAHWTRLSYIATLDVQGGSGGTAKIYCKPDELGGWYGDQYCSQAISSVTPPTREGYAFRGFFNRTFTTIFINPDGSFADAMRSTCISVDAALYAAWVQIRTCTLDRAGGTGGTSAIYSHTHDDSDPSDPESGWYADTGLSEPLDGVAPPVRAGYSFEGYFTAATGGAKYINADGSLVENFPATIAHDATLYAQWSVRWPVVLSPNGGHGGTGEIYYDHTLGLFYGADGEAIDAVEIPTRECFAFSGFEDTGGTSYIAPDGAIDQQLLASAMEATASMTPEGELPSMGLVATWTRVAYKCALESPYSGGTEAIYYVAARSGFYATYAPAPADDPLSAVALPCRRGHACVGFSADATAQHLFIETLPDSRSTGEIAAESIASDTTIYPVWEPRRFVMSFERLSGVSKTVTFGEAVGALPSPASVPQGAVFDGWFLGGAKITDGTYWDYDDETATRAGAVTLTPRFKTAFSNVTDWFGLASDALVPIESSSGDDAKRICCRDLGRANGASFADIPWRNPTVKYLVVADVVLSVTLGKAFAATKSGRNVVASGYMITSAAVSTASRAFPVVTVSAVANEGADAINKFAVSVQIMARARAQNLMGAIGGDMDSLESCTLVASCDPVVLAFGGAPCASDVVKGRIEVSAETRAVRNSQSAPTSAAPFTATGITTSGIGTGYSTHTIKAIKEL